MWHCLDCQRSTHLDTHGRCEKCQSDAIFYSVYSTDHSIDINERVDSLEHIVANLIERIKRLEEK